MKADSTSQHEISVRLSEKEISELEAKALFGIVRLRDRDGNLYSQRDIELVLGDLKENLSVELAFLPEHTDYQHITKYLVTMSQEGYKMLKEYGRTGDRTGGPSRVDIFNEHRRLLF